MSILDDIGGDKMRYQVIYKYELVPGRNVLRLPFSSEILTTRVQGEPFSSPPAVVVWVKQFYPSGIDFDLLENVELLLAQTGDEIPSKAKYIGTGEADNGIIWHVFEINRT